MADRRTRVQGPGRSGPGRGRDDQPRRPRAPGEARAEEVDPDTVTRPVPAQRDEQQPGTPGEPAVEAGPAPDGTQVRAPRAPRRALPLRARRASTEERNRRRFARRQWARRWLAWRAVLAAVVLIAAGAAAAWVLLESSVLGVEEVDVSGTQLLGERQVVDAADVGDGEPLAALDLEAIERRVESLAEVQEATVTRAWPHAVAVRVTERRAIAVVEMSGQLRGMDASGVLFRDFGGPPRALPRIEMPAGTESEAMLEAARVITALPGDLAMRVDHVEVASVDTISLVLRGGRRIEWGSAEQSTAKAEVVDALLRAVPAAVYDVSVPAQPTTTQQP